MRDPILYIIRHHLDFPHIPNKISRSQYVMIIWQIFWAQFIVKIQWNWKWLGKIRRIRSLKKWEKKTGNMYAFFAELKKIFVSSETNKIDSFLAQVIFFAPSRNVRYKIILTVQVPLGIIRNANRIEILRS